MLTVLAWGLLGGVEAAGALGRGAPAGMALALVLAWGLVGAGLARLGGRWASPWAAPVIYLLGSALRVVEARGVGLVLAAVGASAIAWVLLRLVRDRLAGLGVTAAIPAALAGLALRGAPVSLPSRPAAPVPAATGPTILLLTIDTLRADLVLPTFDALAARGLTGPAWSTAPWTLPALATIQTGLTPYGHGAIVRAPVGGVTRVGSIGAPTLAERLHAAGWRTGAFVENPHLSVARGFARGFDTWDSADERDPPRSLLADPFGFGLDGRPLANRGRDAEGQVARATAWLAAGDRPSFLWVHLLGPHLPYHHADLGPGTPLGDALGVGNQARLDLDLVRRGTLRWTPALRADLRRAYDAEARRADAALATLVAAAGPDAVVLYTADHGEAFGEHGAWEHGHALTEELVRVPLAVAGPGVAAGIFAGPASLVDVAPTLLALAGLGTDGPAPAPAPAIAGAVDGRDLRALPPTRDLFLEDTLYAEEREGVVRWPWKLVRTLDGTEIRLADLAADPGEVADHAAEAPEVVTTLGAALDAEHLRLGETPPGSVGAAVRALGYTE
jgi:arylsulfatase A-like enzyme